jgi:hypothetical protein
MFRVPVQCEPWFRLGCLVRRPHVGENVQRSRRHVCGDIGGNVEAAGDRFRSVPKILLDVEFLASRRQRLLLLGRNGHDPPPPFRRHSSTCLGPGRSVGVRWVMAHLRAPLHHLVIGWSLLCTALRTFLPPAPCGGARSLGPRRRMSRHPQAWSPPRMELFATHLQLTAHRQFAAHLQPDPRHLLAP